MEDEQDHALKMETVKHSGALAAALEANFADQVLLPVSKEDASLSSAEHPHTFETTAEERLQGEQTSPEPIAWSKNSSHGQPCNQDHDPQKKFENSSPAKEINDVPSSKEKPLKVNKLHKFQLYETSARFYLVGSNMMEDNFRVLKIDRTSPPGQLNVTEDEMAYDKTEKDDLISTIEDGNKASGGIKLKYSIWGLLGFIRFTDAYYMLVVTKRQQVAMLGGHYIYQIEATALIPLTAGSGSRFVRERNPEEVRFIAILNNLDLSRSFYFSHSYNITRTLQHNIIRERDSVTQGVRYSLGQDLNDMFVWNSYLLGPAVKTLKKPFDWCLPVVHGFVDQASLDVYGRRLYITIIARRSRFYAGARFLKRGANDLGYVANDVETEQIVSEMVTTSFHAPGPWLFANPKYTAYVHHRGSIPLYWTQDNTGVAPKPDIDLNLIDPFYLAAALHFDNLFARYGSPIIVLNLIKSRERTPRESKLLNEYINALNYLNQFLPDHHRIIHKGFDMSRASKSRGQDVIDTLEEMAEDILKVTGFFHNGGFEDEEPMVQNGVCRTNCIDCLDRTNAAQFVVGKRALGWQLKALGIISIDRLEYDTDVVDLFTHMFHNHGDTIAVQYGGSHLVNTLETYRKLNHWQSNSRDMVETFKRYYHNSFLDAQRQEAYNLFLGNYVFAHGQPMLWDLTTDYYLHHFDPRRWAERSQRSYIEWFTPEYLARRTLPPGRGLESGQSGEAIARVDNYWGEYYRPLVVSSFSKVFSYRMNTNMKYLPPSSTESGPYNHSPFHVRKQHRDHHSPDKHPLRKGVTILNPNAEIRESQREPAKRFPAPVVWLNAEVDAQPVPHKHDILQDLLSEFASAPTTSTTFKPADKSLMTQWTLKQFYDNALNPSVTESEAEEYLRYVEHPHNLPLVVSDEGPGDDSYLDFLNYLSIGGAQKEPEVGEDDVADLWEFLTVAENPLTVLEEDGERKRYKAYRQWLRGKSFFKQSKVDPEYKA